MYEEPADIAWLQQLLDRSRGKASEHLQSIISADRAVPARDLVERLSGMRTLALSTVSAAYLEGDTFGVFTPRRCRVPRR
jgi:hypothetical protein